jgi:hypothetical protein
MYGVAGDTRPIFLESDAFLYNLDEPTKVTPAPVLDLPLYWVSP